jgi:hypothetical protein
MDEAAMVAEEVLENVEQPQSVEEQLREAHIRNAQLAHELATQEALLQQYEKEHARAKSKGLDLSPDAPIFTDDSSVFNENIRHKIHGGPPAVGEAVEREVRCVRMNVCGGVCIEHVCMYIFPYIYVDLYIRTVRAPQGRHHRATA